MDCIIRHFFMSTQIKATRFMKFYHHSENFQSLYHIVDFRFKETVRARVCATLSISS